MSRLRAEKTETMVRMRFATYDAQAAAPPNAFSRLTDALSNPLRLVSSDAAIGYVAYDAIHHRLERIDAAVFVLSQTLKAQLLDDTELKST